MEVILLERMRKIGALGETVKVKSGYARNFLVPQGKAVYATQANIAKFEQRRAELEQRESEKQQKAIARQQALQALPAITLTAKAGEEGKLFGSITTRDIAEALEKMGAVVDKHEIQLPEASIRTLGDYDIIVELEGDITATLKLNVVAQA